MKNKILNARYMSAILALILFSTIGCEINAPGSEYQPANVELLAFTAAWCPACQRDKPRLAELRREGLKISTIDADAHPELLHRHGVKLLPTYIVLEKGVEVKRSGDINTIGKRK